ncbi:hypothetical protein P4S72_15475 [Vibrio sp. PP-XX7]
MKDKLQAAISVKLKGINIDEQPPRLVRSNAAFNTNPESEKKKNNIKIKTPIHGEWVFLPAKKEIKMNQIKAELYDMLESFDVKPSKEYKDCIEMHLTTDLSFTSELMVGLCQTIFRSKKMMAYYLLHNSLMKPKAQLVFVSLQIVTASEELKQKMMRHYYDEMNHSKMFASLIPLTGFEAETYNDGVSEELEKICRL